ncbi:MAG: BtaA family protein [Victivallales bacterium]|nr:BtaA family protein [Victivallales bacterium]
MMIKGKLIQKAHDLLFRSVHRQNLIYNTCWEDPRIDREAMKIGDDSRIVMISSAGCNALDYLLDSPEQIHAVDMNPRQNALVELKKAVFKHGRHEDLYAMFGIGFHPEIKTFYGGIRDGLPGYARKFWDRKIYYFGRPRVRDSFFYHGTAGKAAWVFKSIFRSSKTLKRNINLLLDAKTLDEQKAIYAEIEKKLWNNLSRKLVKNPLVMTLLGVPRPQIRLINEKYPGKIEGYVKDKMRHVFTEIPVSDNYFWRVYFTGSYKCKCCPNYLKEENFEFLKEHVGKIRCFTMSYTDFLKRNPGCYTHFVLLDHQDWLAWHDPEALKDEWAEIVKNSSRGGRILLRSAGSDLAFLGGVDTSMLKFHEELTALLHRRDRVGTYGSFHMAEVL